MGLERPNSLTGAGALKVKEVRRGGRLIWAVPAAVCFSAFLSGPFRQLGTDSVPGDVGDARLVNYFLENVYLFLSGTSPSLWDLPFLWPYPLTLGLSENLFGAAIFYLIPRLLFDDPLKAFQLWFYVGYFVNFGACYFVLRKLGLSAWGASAGALIFAFALPTSAHAGHAQLHYRFAIPLGILSLTQFLLSRGPKHLVGALGWLVVQLWVGIYSGFFLLLFFAALLLSFALLFLGQKLAGPELLPPFPWHWKMADYFKSPRMIAQTLVLVASLAVLFLPYLSVRRYVQIERPWSEISSMLPRWRSYLISDSSILWSQVSDQIQGLPSRHEHQMFFGIFPIVLALVGVFLVLRLKLRAPLLITVAAGILVLATLSVRGNSIWYFIHDFPGLSSLRALTRIDQTLLFAVGLLAGLAISEIFRRKRGAARFLGASLVALILTEGSLTRLPMDSTQEWRDRLALAAAVKPGSPLPDDVWFFAQTNGPFYADELDAMWVSAENAVSTMNGYTGSLPPGWRLNFGDQCAEIPRRIVSFLNWGASDASGLSYAELMSVIVPIGFPDCDEGWWTEAPVSVSDAPYSGEELSGVSIAVEELHATEDGWVVVLRLSNSSPTRISAMSDSGNSLWIGSRSLLHEGSQEPFVANEVVPLDLLPWGVQTVKIRMPHATFADGNHLEISVLQENAFWLHEIGMPTVSVSQR